MQFWDLIHKENTGWVNWNFESILAEYCALYEP
jgi:hypothetical protein